MTMARILKAKTRRSRLYSTNAYSDVVMNGKVARRAKIPKSKLYSTNAYFEMVMNRKLYKTVPGRVLRNPKVKEETAPVCKPCFECCG